MYDRLNRLVFPFLKFHLNLCKDGLNSTLFYNKVAFILSSKIAGVELYLIIECEIITLEIVDDARRVYILVVSVECKD